MGCRVMYFVFVFDSVSDANFMIHVMRQGLSWTPGGGLQEPPHPALAHPVEPEATAETDSEYGHDDNDTDVEPEPDDP